MRVSVNKYTGKEQIKFMYDPITDPMKCDMQETKQHAVRNIRIHCLYDNTRIAYEAKKNACKRNILNTIWIEAGYRLSKMRVHILRTNVEHTQQ